MVYVKGASPFGRFWAQNPIFWGQGLKLLVPSYQESNETPFSCWKHWSMRLQLAARGKNVLFLPKNLDIWGKKSFFCMVIVIFVNRAYHKYTRGYNFLIRTTPKKISISEQWVIFRGSPLFLAVSGHSPITNLYLWTDTSPKRLKTGASLEKWPLARKRKFFWGWSEWESCSPGYSGDMPHWQTSQSLYMTFWP